MAAPPAAGTVESGDGGPPRRRARRGRPEGGEMRSAIHARAFAGLAAVLAAVAITATAAAATTYQLTGVETAATATTATFQGVLGSPGGTWQGMIVHEALDKAPHGVTAIVQSTSGG